jgi:tryptophan synthase beta chain
MNALSDLARTEGILVAIETAHAMAGAIKLGKVLGPGCSILINCSGRGDKDVVTAANWFGMPIGDVIA